MDYNFNFLTPGTFEHLIQSLSRKILGNGLITFGDGPDGGREATFEGKAPFPSETDLWTGRWVIQAKFKAMEDNKKDFNWVKKEFENEMKKFETRKVKVEIPDNYLFFTNVVLTPTAKTGGRDKIEELAKKYKSKIKNIKIFGYDDLFGFLENNRDVAVAYASFILPGDILQLLYKMLQQMDVSKKSHQDLLGRFLEAEFLDNLQSRLDHAGKLTSDKVHLEKVFVDLYATRDGIVPKDEKQKKFLELCLEEGNNILRQDTKSLRYVLIGGPGFGKSTLTQFLCQVYRAYFLKNIDKTQIPLPEIHSFIEDLKEIMPITPTCSRFPFKIKLKDLAGWIAEQKAREERHTMLLYLKYRLEKKGPGSTIEIEDIEQLLKTLSFVFVFDGLDEVPVTSNRKDVLEELNNFADIDLRRYNCDAMVIATTRPQGYTTEFDTSRYTHLTITDLKEEDCLVYLERLLEAIDPVEEEREGHFKILNNALEDDIISPLMRSPLQASIMAILVKSGGEPPRYKYDLFAEYYNIIFKRERQKNICRILNENPEYIDDIHYKLGFNLQLSSEQSENPYSHISIDDFRNLALDYLKGVELTTDEAQAKTDQILQATTQRLVFLEEVEDGKIGFNIRSLQEYFAANYYVRNQPDGIICERLKAMCKSSYWRNTFLFALGYIYKHKNYIIDTVESICLELNGSTDDPGNTRGSAVCKLGSWLALDILIEGIFRGNPKFENKFARLLEDLFTISPSYKHSMFGILSDDINERWILPYIDKYTSQGNYEEQLAGWTIGIYLLRYHFEPVTGIFDKNWLTGEEEVKLVKHFIKLKTYDNDWFIEKFLNPFKKNPVFTFYEEFGRDRKLRLPWQLSFIERVSSSGSIDIETKRILLQNLFFLSLEGGYKSRGYIELIHEILGQDIFKLTTVSNNNVVTIRITGILGKQNILELKFFDEEYRIKILSVRNDDPDLTKLLKIFSSYNINYLRRLMEFLVEPNKNSLKKFVEELANEPNDVINFVTRKIKKINWILSKIFYNDEPLKKIVDNIEQNKYGDIEDWLEYEDKISMNKFDHKILDILDYSSQRSFRKLLSISTFRDFHKKIYLKFRNDANVESKVGLYLEFLHLTNWSFRFNSEILKEYIKKGNSIIDELLFSLKKVGTSYFGERILEPLIYNLFFCLSEQEIMDTAKKEKKLLEKFKFDQKDTMTINPHLMADIFPKLSKVLNIHLALKYESPIIRVLLWNLLTQEDKLITVKMNVEGSITYEKSRTEMKIVDLLNINYNDLHQATFENSENETCRILLCLFDPDMNQPKANRMVEISNQLVKDVPKLPGYIIQLIEKFKIKGDWIEPFLLDIYQLVDKYDHDLKTKFENYLKDMLETLPSHLNEEAVRKELNLVN